MKVDKIRDYLFIVYETDDFKRWIIKEGIKLN